MLKDDSEYGLYVDERSALLNQNRTLLADDKVHLLFGGVVPSTAAAGIGLGWLFRTIATGGHATALAHAATPILSAFFPILALANAGLAVVRYGLSATLSAHLEGSEKQLGKMWWATRRK